MEPRILCISTYSELTQQVRRISQEIGVPIQISEGGILNDGHLYAKKREADYDVIISQGGTAAGIKNVVHDIPVISIQITIGDILRALAKAVAYNKPLALISYRCDELAELEDVAKLLYNIEYRVFPYANRDEFTKQIANVMSLSEHTIIGMGGCIRGVAKKHNMDFVLINSSEKNIRQAILSAKSIVDKSCRDKLMAQRMVSIMESSWRGIVSVDKFGTVTTFNTAAEKILRMNSKSARDASVTREPLATLYGDGDSVSNKLIKVKGREILINRIPIKINNEREETIITFQELSDIQNAEYSARTQLYAKGLVAKNTFGNIIGASKSVRRTIQSAKKYSKTSATILVEGETGTGKELFAQSIHNDSPRAEGPFVAINCAALPDSLLESELFGHDEGAFTGARKGGKPGLFEIAHNGTIFLDEIGELSPALQSRMLRVLQEKEILRVGGDRIINVDVRVIAATNRNLYKMMMEGAFREDLYFRINILNLIIEPLRNRKEDIPLLVSHFLTSAVRKYDLAVRPLCPECLGMLQEYQWPGNVRELEIFIEKLVILTETPDIDIQFVEKVLKDHTGNQHRNAMQSLDTITVEVGSLRDMEMQIIETLLKKYNGNKNLLAKSLGISRVTVWNKLNEKGRAILH